MTSRIMLLGVEDSVKSFIASAVSGAELAQVPYDLDKLGDPIKPGPAVIVCGMPKAPVVPAEVAQLLRGVYQNVPVFLVLNVERKADRQLLIKNGMTEVFFLPIDEQIFKHALENAVAASGSQTNHFRPIKLGDVVPNTELDFDTFLYLPANRKYVNFSKAGDPIDSERAARLKTHAVNSLSVRATEMSKFYSYAAKTIRQKLTDRSVSETERAEQAESAIRNLLTSLFNDAVTSTDVGKQTISDLNQVIEEYLKAEPTEGEFYQRVLATTTQGNSLYSHAVNVSTLGALFALGLNSGFVTDIAIAGVLHDLGLASVPKDILDAPEERWLPMEREVYQRHPERTLDMIRDRKLVVSDEVRKIILQHHETFSGHGFPKKISGSRISIGAQILAIADDFDYRTSVKPGRVTPKPVDAMRSMLTEATANPALARHDPTLLQRILKLMQEG